jgi:hypothetical protein
MNDLIMFAIGAIFGVGSVVFHMLATIAGEKMADKHNKRKGAVNEKRNGVFGPLLHSSGQEFTAEEYERWLSNAESLY